MTVWKFFFAETACSNTGTAVTYTIDSGQPIRPYGSFQVLCTVPISERKKFVMDQILKPGLTWDGQTGIISYQITDPVYVNGIFYSGNKLRKELVTNLTSNETIVRAAVILAETTNATYISKYQEGQNWVFVFEFDREPAYVELGAGATFTKFVAKNWKTIAAVLVSLGVVAIVWLWRDAVTAVPEAQAQISANDTQSLAEILNNPTLTPEQKTSLVETVLKKTYGDLTGATGADSGSYILYGIGILAAAYIIGEMMKGRR